MSSGKRLLIVDGYNVLNFAWPGLMGKPLDDARDRMIEQLHDYAGYSGQAVVAVFDAWKSDRMDRSIEIRGGLTIVFTRRGETADQYIERLCDDKKRLVDARKIEIRVATSDLVEQTVIFGRGAVRMSARELVSEMDAMRALGRRNARPKMAQKSTVMDALPGDVRAKLERLRRG